MRPFESADVKQAYDFFKATLKPSHNFNCCVNPHSGYVVVEHPWWLDKSYDNCCPLAIMLIGKRVEGISVYASTTAVGIARHVWPGFKPWSFVAGVERWSSDPIVHRMNYGEDFDQEAYDLGLEVSELIWPAGVENQ